MFPSYRRLVLVTALASILAFSITGCRSKGPVFVDEGTSYTTTSVDHLIDVADIKEFADKPTTEATALRHTALSSLRKQGDAAARAADLLTATFEPDTRGVPVYVEQASLEGTSVIIVIEATGSKTGTFKTKRLWVLGGDGSVILARSR